MLDFNIEKDWIYISGAITGTDDYMERFNSAESHMKQRGFIPVNPAKVNRQIPDNATWEQYMEVAMTLLKMCKAIYMLDGWEHSRGASREWHYAKEHDYQIVYETAPDDYRVEKS